MNMQKFILFTAACAITGAGFTASSAAAAKPNKPITVTGPRIDEDVISTRVSYRDLNLAHARDETQLVWRVGSAVKFVCPDQTLGSRTQLRTCRSYAWDGAKPQIALAVERAKQIASAGFSSIAPVAIVISVRQ